VLTQLHQVAPTSSTVLLLGETGVGKEIFAQALHDASPRRHRPMIRVSCAALPATLIESELFGHERGAFTNAVSRQIGRFEAANGSTLFLDEILATSCTLTPTIPCVPFVPSSPRSTRLVDVQSRHMTSVLESCGWRVRGINGAAERLGSKPTTLETRMAKLGISRPGQ
jgi:transcriptional regulator with GAF, ATPase, and Fis domain